MGSGGPLALDRIEPVVAVRAIPDVLVTAPSNTPHFSGEPVKTRSLAAAVSVDWQVRV